MKITVSTILIIISASSSIITSILLVVSLLIAAKRQKQAYAGDVEAGAKLILPVYSPLFSGLAIFFLALSIGQLATMGFHSNSHQVFYELQYHSICLVAVYMISPILLIQHSISKKAFINTFVTIISWFVILSIIWGVSVREFLHGNDEAVFILQLLVSLLLFLPPFLLCVGILARLMTSRVQLGSRSNRSSSEFLLVFSIVLFILNIYQNTVFHHERLDQAVGVSVALVTVTFVWNSFFAFSLHRSLLADTKYWRGIGTHNRQGMQSQRVQEALPMPTMDMSVASTHFQDMMENIGKIVIDFAYLEVKKKIGDGASANVYSGMYKGTEVAIKISTPAEITEEVIDVFVKEGMLASALQHPNVVRFHGLCVRPPQIAMVMELCAKGDLKSCLKKNKDYWTQVKRIQACLGACRGLAYLHGQGFIHRDLKTENFFVDNSWNVKLGDFGESTRAKTKEVLNGRRMTIVGTVSYMAPEVIAAAKFYTTAIDVYALAITFWEIMSGLDCFEERSQFEIYSAVGKGIRPDMSAIADVPEALRQLIDDAWDQNPDFRPSAQDMVRRLETIVLDLGGDIDTFVPQADDENTTRASVVGDFVRAVSMKITSMGSRSNSNSIRPKKSVDSPSLAATALTDSIAGAAEDVGSVGSDVELGLPGEPTDDADTASSPIHSTPIKSSGEPVSLELQTFHS